MRKDGSCRATCRSLDGSIPSFWRLILQGNLGKILFHSLGRIQQIAGLTLCDIYFKWKKKCPPSNVKTSLSQTNTHTQSLKCRRASPPFSEPRGTLQEHRGEVATDLPFSVTSQRSPTLLPFHKQPKDHRARLGKLRSHREGKLPKQTSRYKPELAMKPGLYVCEWPLTGRKAIGKMGSLKIKMSSWMVADPLLSWWADITASLSSSWTHILNVIFCSWHEWLPISTAQLLLALLYMTTKLKKYYICN